MIKQLYKLQENLDTLIANKFVNTNNKNEILNWKIISLYVELGELANETRCFKYWSINTEFKSRETVIEEYADGLHFLLSIGNEIDQNKSINYQMLFTMEVPTKLHADNKTLARHFLKLFALISEFQKSFNNEQKIDLHAKLMEQYFILGKNLGFSYEDIVSAYKNKNCINHSRLKNNY